MTQLAIVDYGLGNIKSISNAFESLQVRVVLTRDPDILLKADGVVLPGVGAFPYAKQKLVQYDLVTPLKAFVATQKPLLGICLGMQLLLEESEEFELTEGLGFIRGKVKKLSDPSRSLKLPHVGWNELHEPRVERWKKTIFDSIQPQSDVYFVHSFAAFCENEADVLSETSYDQVTFCSAIQNGNVMGCQFHPEKSGKVGLQILKNFIHLVQQGV